MDSLNLPVKALFEKGDITDEMLAILKCYCVRDIRSPENVKNVTHIEIEYDGTDYTSANYTSFWYMFRTNNKYMLEKFPYPERIKYMKDKLTKEDWNFAADHFDILKNLNENIFSRIISSNTKYSCIRIMSDQYDYIFNIIKVHKDFILVTLTDSKMLPLGTDKTIKMSYFESDD